MSYPLGVPLVDTVRPGAPSDFTSCQGAIGLIARAPALLALRDGLLDRIGPSAFEPSTNTRGKLPSDFSDFGARYRFTFAYDWLVL